MGMTPWDYFESFVEGNGADCWENQGDIRRAFNAAVAASHFADHYFAFHQRHNPGLIAQYPKIGAFVEHLDNQTGGAFKDVRSISNAYKHLYTNVDGHAVHSSVSSSGAIDFLSLPDDPELESFEENYRSAENGADSRVIVIFRRKNGSSAEFFPVLEKVIEYLRKIAYDGLSERSV